MGTDVPAGPQAPPREYPARPIIGVGGLVVRDGSVLLVKRGRPPGVGLWSIPGGAVKTGEPLEAALRREMLEEIGLEVEVGPLVEVVERIIPDDAGRVLYHYVILDHLCRADTGEPRPGDDALEARFVPPEEWRKYGQPDIALNILQKALDITIRDEDGGTGKP